MKTETVAGIAVLAVSVAAVVPLNKWVGEKKVELKPALNLINGALIGASVMYLTKGVFTTKSEAGAILAAG